MEPREVKDRILENISLSVKKVSAACPARPGPRGHPACPAQALDPTQRPLLSSGSLARGSSCHRELRTPPFPSATPGTRSRRELDDGEEAGAAHVSRCL